jgi:hypothetical protein
MRAIQFNLKTAKASTGMDASGAQRETYEASIGVSGTGPTGVRTRSQWSQSGVMDGLGLRHWELSFSPNSIRHLT